jgi:acetyl-CoA acetyltransferase
MTDVHIIGAGIHPFGRHDGTGAIDLGVFAVREALADAGVSWDDLQFAFGGSRDYNADSLLPRMGLTGIQFINVRNGCATGGSALLSAYWAIKSGEFDLGIVVGFDKHDRGAFSALPAQWGLPDWYGETGLMLTTQFFGMKIQRYMGEHGISQRTLGLVAGKAFENGALAPHAWRRTPVEVDTILDAPMISDPLTKYMFCSPAEGAASLVIASDRKMRELGAKGPRILGATVRTRVPGSFEVFSPALDIERGASPTQLAAQAAFERAALGAEDMDVIQIQDTESGAEIMHMAENGFCRDGDQERLIQDGETRIGGKLPVNTDGGCIACGEPVGASGLRQVYENVQQLRGRAEHRQVEGARIAFSQVYGAPGLAACVVLGE